jgi:hypothetical protein
MAKKTTLQGVGDTILVEVQLTEEQRAEKIQELVSLQAEIAEQDAKRIEANKAAYQANQEFKALIKRGEALGEMIITGKHRIPADQDIFEA